MGGDEGGIFVLGYFSGTLKQTHGEHRFLKNINERLERSFCLRLYMAE